MSERLAADADNETGGRSNPRTGMPGRGSGRTGADLASRAENAIEDAADVVREKADQAADWGRDGARRVSRGVSDARRRSVGQLDRGWDRVENFVAENPVMIGVVGLAAGLLVGSLLPLSRRENRVLGPYADEFRDQGARFARDLAEQGKTYLEENLSSVADAAIGRTKTDPAA